MKDIFQIALLACVLSTALSARVICFFTNWSAYGSKPFQVEDVDAKLCTHVVYSFFGLEADGRLKSLDPWNDFGDAWTEGRLKKFHKLKNSNPSVKLMLAVGGWTEGVANFQNMVKSPEKRKAFIESTLNILKQHKLEGLDMSWIFQGEIGYKDDLTELAKELKPKLASNGYVLSISTSTNPYIFENSYDIISLSKHVDFINMMSYNLHGPWEHFTGHGAPLHGMKAYPQDRNYVSAVVEWYLQKGAAASQLNLGLVAYGQTFTLRDPAMHGMRAPTQGPGKVSYLPYRDFCMEDKKGIWTKFWDEEQVVPYAVAGNQWVGQEDVKSIVAKVKYVKSVKLGGVTFWSLDFDDFKGNCGSGKFPLLRAANEEITKALS